MLLSALDHLQLLHGPSGIVNVFEMNISMWNSPYVLEEIEGDLYCDLKGAMSHSLSQIFLTCSPTIKGIYLG